MVNFDRGAFRKDRKREPTPKGKKFAPPRKYRSSGTFTYLTETGEDGKVRLSQEGRWKMEGRLKAIKEKRELIAKSLGRRRRHELLETLFTKPIKFKTTDEKKVRILRHGFANIFKESEKVKPRAFVIVFVNGRKLFFYKSSGEASKMPGEWFPTAGPDIISWEQPTMLGHLIKMEGHPVVYGEIPQTSFPKWIDEIRQKIKTNEPKLALHSDWGVEKYLEITEALKVIPSSKELKTSTGY